MNGRIYDPLLGRFLSADTVVQYPGDLQNYNRYSYVNNNPLTYRDPSGHIIETLWDVANVAMGVKSLIGNIREGNVGSAILDGVGIVADTAAAIVPCIPGGAGTAIKVARGTAAVAGKIEKIANTANAASTVVTDLANGDVNVGTVTSALQVASGTKGDAPKLTKGDAPNVNRLTAEDVKAKKGDTIAKNQSKGKAGADAAEADLQKQGYETRREVRTADGTSQVDIVAFKKDNPTELTAVEVKTGDAKLTKGQKGVAARTANGEGVAVNETTKVNKDLV